MKVIVCGAGTMGSGIAQVIAQKGNKVVIVDKTEDLVSKGIIGINKTLEKIVAKGKLGLSEKELIMGNITVSTSLNIKDASLVIEAIFENMEAKKEIFKELDSSCPADTIFASNTSSLSISEMAAVTKRPDRFIGIHFFNPAPVMELVEVIKGANTSEETINKTRSFIKSIGKTPVEVQESPGFVVNRMLVPMINEAIFILMEGVASAEDIDAAMKMGANHPIGPLALADLIGLDVCLFVMETLYNEFGDDKYRPCPLLRKMVRAGHLGRKTGKGFFSS
ncbi:MAG: 3-hydroxybutyryl-CoA dehydrogenase [Clostridiaceae bacterium BRH_c20a]|nr:MAG: 3-hydroxybutyryl-CoA dehydrogenase [Clostridiaceae bacterium BRH_c20a]